MASIQWVDGRAEIRMRKPGTNKQTTLRLGTTNDDAAKSIKKWVERLITAARHDERDEEAIRWAKARPDWLYDRLHAAGLVVARQRREPVNLGNMLAAFLTSADVKPATKTRMEQACAALERHFGKTSDPKAITQTSADEWRAALAKRYAKSTVSRTVLYARQIFRWGVRRGMVDTNPFAELKAGAQVNTARRCFVDRETIVKVIEAAPDAEWRLLIALSRFGGFRVPSEALALRWTDVDWEHNRLTVRSSKTEHHEGGGERIIPLFTEIRGPLMEVFEAAPEGAVQVITQYREGSNLNPQLRRIIKRAGVQAWPKAWHNLRASRQTELAADYPLHTVCAWIGNTKAIAAGHYLQVTDADWTRAVTPGATTNPTTTGAASAPQNPTHHKPEPRFGGHGRGESALVGVSNGQAGTRTRDLSHVKRML